MSAIDLALFFYFFSALIKIIIALNIVDIYQFLINLNQKMDPIIENQGKTTT